MSQHTARAESWELAVACARLAAGLGDEARVVELAANIPELGAAIAMARDQAVLGWLAPVLTGRGLPAVDAMVREASVCDAGRALAQVRLLGALTDAFAQAGIPMLPYKGPALSFQLY